MINNIDKYEKNKDHHDTLPPSSFPMFKKCPCFKSSGRVSEYADEGTRQHSVLENAINTGKLPEDKDENLQWAYDYIEFTFKNYYPDVDYAKVEKLTEERIEILDKYFNVISFGSADLIIKDILFDLKSGMPRDYKYQMMMYARGYMQRTFTDSMKVVELYPRAMASKEYILTLSDCILETDIIIANVMNPNKEPNPNEYCKWCGNVAECKPLKNAIGKVLKSFNAEFPIEVLENINKDTLKNSDTLGKALDLCRIYLKAFDEYVEAEAKEFVLAGALPEGYKIQLRAGKKEIKDVTALFQSLDLSPDEFLSACNIVLTKLQKKLNMKKSEFDAFIEPFTQRGSDIKMLVKAKE